MKEFRIGIFGGTFNPIHNGHINAVLKFKEMVSLDKLILVPSNIPPHKRMPNDIDPEMRLDMVKIATGEIKGIEVSDIEIKRAGKSFTFDTLNGLKSCYQGSELYFLMGTDMFVSFESWFRAADVASLCTICVVTRTKGDIAEILEFEKIHKLKFELKTLILDIDPIDISSTTVRDLLAQGKDVSEYLPWKIIDYIKSKKLYKCEKEIVL